MKWIFFFNLNSCDTFSYYQQMTDNRINNIYYYHYHHYHHCDQLSLTSSSSTSTFPTSTPDDVYGFELVLNHHLDRWYWVRARIRAWLHGMMGLLESVNEMLHVKRAIRLLPRKNCP